jgi:uncharacterized membrane protein YoaT (DUF817 family)
MLRSVLSLLHTALNHFDATMYRYCTLWLVSSGAKAIGASLFGHANRWCETPSCSIKMRLDHLLAWQAQDTMRFPLIGKNRSKIGLYKFPMKMGLF